MRGLSSLAVYADRRMLVLLALGFSSGLPLLLVFSTLTLWLKDAGLAVGTIGLFAATRTPYSIKFLWAPLLDRLPIPGLTRLLGRRRSWMLVTQLGLLVTIAALGLSDPAGAPLVTAGVAVACAALSASQDVVIDAYRIDRLSVAEQGAGAAAAVTGYRLGMLASGAGALYLNGYGLSWPATYLIMAALMGVGVLATLLCREPEAEPQAAAGTAADATGHGSASQPGGARRQSAWLLFAEHVRAGVVAPLVDLVRRRGAVGFALLVAFVLLYKLGDALAATLGNVFLVEIGFTKIQIANIAKTYGLLAAIVGVLLGGWLVRAVGLWRALWIAGFVQMASNLMYALQARVGADATLLIATVGIEDISSGVGTAAFVAYLSGLCNKAYSATQYALLTALSGMLRNFLSASAGYLTEALGWQDFFLLTTAAAVPGLLMLYALSRWGAGPSDTADAAPGARTQA